MKKWVKDQLTLRIKQNLILSFNSETYTFNLLKELLIMEKALEEFIGPSLKIFFVSIVIYWK